MLQSYYSRNVVEKIDKRGKFYGEVSTQMWKSGDREVRVDTSRYSVPKYLTEPILYEVRDEGELIDVVKVELEGDNYYIPITSWQGSESFSIRNGIIFSRGSKGWVAQKGERTEIPVKASTDPRFYSKDIVETREGEKFNGMIFIKQWRHGDKSMSMTRETYHTPKYSQKMEAPYRVGEKISSFFKGKKEEVEGEKFENTTEQFQEQIEDVVEELKESIQKILKETRSLKEMSSEENKTREKVKWDDELRKIREQVKEKAKEETDKFRTKITEEGEELKKNATQEREKFRMKLMQDGEEIKKSVEQEKESFRMKLMEEGEGIKKTLKDETEKFRAQVIEETEGLKRKATEEAQELKRKAEKERLELERKASEERNVLKMKAEEERLGLERKASEERDRLKMKAEEESEKLKSETVREIGQLKKRAEEETDKIRQIRTSPKEEDSETKAGGDERMKEFIRKRERAREALSSDKEKELGLKKKVVDDEETALKAQIKLEKDRIATAEQSRIVENDKKEVKKAEGEVKALTQSDIKRVRPEKPSTVSGFSLDNVTIQSGKDTLTVRKSDWEGSKPFESEGYRFEKLLNGDWISSKGDDLKKWEK